MEEEKKLLVISSGYPDKNGEFLNHTFVKGYVDEAKKFYSKVDVVVLLPYLPIFFGVSYKKFSKDLENYQYENISVKYLKYPYIPIKIFSLIRGKIAYYFTKSKIEKLISKESIIHANFTSPAGVYANLLSKKYKKEYILTVHEDHNWLSEEINSNNKLFEDSWRKAKVLIRVNKLDNDILKRYNKNVVSIPNGFNHNVFKKLDKKKCRNRIKTCKEFVIVNIGFYNVQKNQKLLIEAIDLLPNYIKENLSCFIIGGGVLEKELISLVKSKGLNNIVEIIGQVKHDDLPIYLNASDIFCLSSNSEGNPTVMFEALGVGLPYIGANVGGVPEIIKSDEYGLMCRPKDEVALSFIIKKGLEKEWDRKRIQEYASKFSWKNIFLETRKYY